METLSLRFSLSKFSYNPKADIEETLRCFYIVLITKAAGPVRKGSEPQSKKRHVSKTIAASPLVDEETNIIIPFDGLSACVTTLNTFADSLRPIIILHGPFATGKKFDVTTHRKNVPPRQK